MSHRRKNPISDDPGESAFTWFFAGLLAVALIAGLLGQVAAG